MSKKQKIAIVSLTSCNGCQVEVVNLGRKFLDILEFVEIGDFPLIEEKKEKFPYDVAFVEGNPVTRENEKYLKFIRDKSKILVALGACACLGSVQEIKNYRNKSAILPYVYKRPLGIDNLEIRPLKHYVKVDFELPGCPPSKEEIFEFISDYLRGKIFKISQRPVCYECQLREVDCLLQKGKLCLGPIILGGCKAVCPASGIQCYGCRGLLEEPDLEDAMKVFKKVATKKEIEESLEIFGLRDDLEKKLKEMIEKRKKRL